MSSSEQAEQYAAALKRFEESLYRAADGTFYLTAEDGRSLGIEPAIFATFMASLEETNRKIRRGEIDPKQITRYAA